VIKKEAEKILKYKDVILEIQHMWNVKAKVIPLIMGVTGTISKSFTQHLSNVSEKQEIKQLQKIATLGTVHIHRKVLMYKFTIYLIYFMCTITLHVAHIENTQQLQHYIPKKHSFFEYTIVHTLYTVDSE